MGECLLARVHALLSIRQTIVALALLVLHKHVHLQTILVYLNSSAVKLIAMLMMIQTAHLPALVDLITILPSVHELKRGIMCSLFSNSSKKL